MAATAARIIAQLWLSAVTLCSAEASRRFLQASAQGPAVPRVARRRVKVVTDMGFDDWGAFAVLNAAGLDPEAALATKGMMQPSNFSSNFATLLASWGLATQVYNGTEKCFQAEPCAANTDFIESLWGYSSKVRAYFAANATGHASSVGGTRDGADFWGCGAGGEKYTLLVLSPVSDVATALLQDKRAAGCIEEIVFSGSFFVENAQGSVLSHDDPATNASLVGQAPNLLSADGPRAELNVAADAKAASALLSSALLLLGVPVRIIPIEIESVDRIGKSGSKIDVYAQNAATNAEVDKLCKVSLDRGTPLFLGNLACLHKAGGDVATLDFDAIVATYLWTPELFTFAPRKVSINNVTGITSLCDDNDFACVEQQVAIDFDVKRWFENLRDALSLEVHRGLNCYPGRGGGEPKGLPEDHNDPFLLGPAKDVQTMVTLCETACNIQSDCDAFVIGARFHGCYLRSGVTVGECAHDDDYDTYLVRPELAEFQLHKGYNCYSLRGGAAGDYHGADDPQALPAILNSPYLSRTLEDVAVSSCKRGCAAVADCEGFVIGQDGETFDCYLRGIIRLTHCDYSPGSNIFTTYAKVPK